MKAILFVAAIVACAMAMDKSDFLKYMCSVSATGTASVSGFPVQVSGKMIRVRDNVRYDFLNGVNIIGSYVKRFDWEGAYYYTSMPSPTCEFAEAYQTQLYLYDDEGKNDEGLYVYRLSHYRNGVEVVEGIMYFNENDVLVKEYVNVSSSLEFTFTYTSVDTSFQHNDNDLAFSLEYDQCDSEAAIPASHSKTQSVCVDVTWPDYMCSVSGTGTASLESYYGGETIDVNVEMFRVGNSARYDFIDKKTSNLFASFVLRPDLYRGYLYKPGEPALCAESYSYFSLPSYDFDEVSDDGFDVFGRPDSRGARVFFKHDNQDLAKEFFEIYVSTQSVYISYKVSINYTSINRDYETEGEPFSLTDGSCPDDIQSIDIHGNSSIMCGPVHTVVPVYPGCAFEMVAHFQEYSYGPGVMNFKVLIKDNQPLAVRYSYDKMTEIIRCDIKTRKGNCLIIAHGDLYGEDVCNDDPDEADIDYISYMELFGFEYRGDPIDVLCPDNTDGCKKYCSYSEQYDFCQVYDRQGRLLSTSDDDITFEYTDKVPSISEFADVFCNNSALKAPADPCGHTSSSSAQSSGALTSSSVVGSASFALPSVLLVALVMVFVLF